MLSAVGKAARSWSQQTKVDSIQRPHLTMPTLERWVMLRESRYKLPFREGIYTLSNKIWTLDVCTLFIAGWLFITTGLAYNVRQTSWLSLHSSTKHGVSSLSRQLQFYWSMQCHFFCLNFLSSYLFHGTWSFLLVMLDKLSLSRQQSLCLNKQWTCEYAKAWRLCLVFEGQPFMVVSTRNFALWTMPTAILLWF